MAKNEIDTMCKHDELMNELQEEWEKDNEYHRLQRFTTDRGIRSSQISALVMLLIKEGAL